MRLTGLIISTLIVCSMFPHNYCCAGAESQALEYLAGDINQDCSVDVVDLFLLADNWLATGPSPADIAGEEGVDLVDFTRLAADWQKRIEPVVVINEIHHNPDVKTELVEFVELYNTGPEPVDISGWYFSDGIYFQFPAGTILYADGYVVVTEDPNLAITPISVSQKYGVAAGLVYGPFYGRLSNDGERVVLRNAEGVKVDEVDYGLGFPWPTVGEPVSEEEPGTGYSIQLVRVVEDNDLGELEIGVSNSWSGEHSSFTG